MSLSVTIKGGDLKRLQKKLKKQMDRYPVAMNSTLRALGFDLQGYIIEKYLTVEDGIGIRRRARRNSQGQAVRGTAISPTKRTKPEGLRRVTGRTARSLRVGLLFTSGRFQLLRSKVKTPIKNQIREVQVGLSEPQYAVDHEQKGRKRADGFYPFLQPGLRDFRRGLKNKLSRLFRFYVKQVRS